MAPPTPGSTAHSARPAIFLHVGAAKSGTTVAGDLLNQRALVMTRGNAGYMTSRSGRETVVAAYVMTTPIGAIEEVFGIAQDVGAVVAALWEAT